MLNKISNQGIEAVVVEMTPGLAMKFIGKNTRNRPVSDPTVKKYANLMRKGKWEFNGEPIIVAKDGTLVDGQHRLQAILDSGSTLKMLVVYGVENEAFHTIDIGKKRNGADALATHNHAWAKNRTTLSSAIGTIRSFDDQGIWHGQTEKMNRATHQDIIEFAENNPEIHISVEVASALRNAKKIVPPSCLAALHFLFMKKDEETTEEFFQKLDSGEGLEKNDPILLLRNKLITSRAYGGVFRTSEIIPYVVKAWELIRTGNGASRLVIHANSITQIV